MVGVPWVAIAGGVTLKVRLTPKGGRDSLDGIDRLADGTMVLKARVTAPPSEGAANEALCRLIAKGTGVPPRNITLIAGGAGRTKRLAIAGDPPTLIAALEKIAATG
jgi:uncharacterized protein YggU (UPF0235/DUF167 family)